MKWLTSGIFIGIILSLVVQSEPVEPQSQIEDLTKALDSVVKLSESQSRAYKIMEDILPNYKAGANFYSIPVTATSYNPLEEQCDNTPLINSHNTLVLPGQLALPQGFRLKLGIHLGQSVMLEGLGIFTVSDHMNSRYDGENRVDIISFIPKWSEKFGIQHNLKLYWWSSEKI